MKYYLTTFLTLYSFSLLGQNTTLEGVVSDSLNNPIELANVMAFYKKDSTVASFGITDGSGRYKLILSQGEAYTLKSSFLGYTTWEGEITAKGDRMKKNLVLKEASKLLNEVEVTYEFPITVSGDTITYKTDQFTIGKERKLGDVLEALPGFEIDDNGDIKVQGKKVNKVLVEGKEFFDGDSKMATKNIPADAVDKIQLLRNYSDVSPMSGLGNDENMAINVQLGEDHKNMWFGDVEVAAGPDDRYLVHPNLFYYSPKVNINFIGDGNNIGEQAFTLRDYFRFSGGIRKLGSKSGSSINLSSDEMGISLMQNEMAKNIDSKLGAVNFNYQPNKKWKFSAYGIASGIETVMQTTSNRTYIRSQETTTENTESDLNQENTSGMFKLSTAYTPNYKTHLEYGAYLKASTISELDNRTSDFGVFTSNLMEGNTKDPFSLDQNLVGYFTLNEKNIISAESSWSFKEQVPQYALNSDIFPLQSILPLAASQTYRVRQNKKIITNAIQGELNYYYIINKTNHINFTMGFNNSQQDLDTKFLQELDNGDNSPISTFDNDVSFQFQDYYAGVHYKTKLGDLTLSPGLNFHLYDVSDEQLGSENRLEKQLIMPDLFAKYTLGSSENLTFNYSLNAQFTDVQNVAMNGIMRNYNSWFVGNRNIENVLFHQASLNYFNFNMFNHTNMFVTLNYQKKYNDIIESISYQITDRFTSPQNVPIWNDMLMSNISFEKKLAKVKFKATANHSYTKYQNEVEQQITENTSFGQQYTISAESKFSNAPNFEIGMKKGWNQYNANPVEQTYVTNSPYIDVEIPFLKNFTLIVDYEYNNYQNKSGTTATNYDFMNAALYYEKEDSPWVLKLSVNNLLETSEIRRDGFSNNIVSTYSYQVLPRYAVFSVKFNL